jgi:transposase-like protein
MSGYSAKVKQEALDLVRKGWKSSDVAYMTGVSECTLRAWRKEAGLPMGLQGRRHPRLRQSVVGMYRAGNSIHAIARTFEVDSSSVRRWLNEAGEKPRNQGGTPQFCAREALALTRKFGTGGAAEVLGVHPGSVRRRIRLAQERGQL